MIHCRVFLKGKVISLFVICSVCVAVCVTFMPTICSVCVAVCVTFMPIVEDRPRPSAHFCEIDRSIGCARETYTPSGYMGVCVCVGKCDSTQNEIFAEGA